MRLFLFRYLPPPPLRYTTLLLRVPSASLYCTGYLPLLLTQTALASGLRQPLQRRDKYLGLSPLHSGRTTLSQVHWHSRNFDVCTPLPEVVITANTMRAIVFQFVVAALFAALTNAQTFTN